MIRILLCALIICAGFGAGYSMARSLTNRRLRLQELQTAISILESEMKYRLDPIPQLFCRVSKLTGGLPGACMEKTLEILKQQEAPDFYESWTDAVTQIYGGSSLKEEDLRILKEFGAELGKTDLKNQASLFSRTLCQLSGQQIESEKLEQSKGKMYKSLGAAAGFFIVIVLI